MKKKLPLLLFILSLNRLNSFSQYCITGNRFTETAVFNATQIREDSLTYANAINWTGANQALKLNVFYPDTAVDSLPKRPMILMIFGGGFVSGNRSQVDAYCTNFAKRGFVAVGIDYRLGKETTLPCSDTLSQEKAVYRAIQDAHAAMRFMVANAVTYKIDTAWLFAGGYSAGAGTALGLVYNSQAEADQVYPSIVDSLGNLNSSGNSLTNTFTIKGIYNNWGGVSSDFFDAADAVPMISFHGGNDGVVPVDSAIDVSCFTTSHYIYGSRALYQKLTAAGICSDLTVKPGAGHGVYQGADGQLMRTSRASCFFKSLFCNTCSNYSATDSLTPSCSATISGIHDNISSENNTSIYPNPFSNQLTFSLADNEPTTVSLYNFLGQQVLRQTFTNSTTINTEQLADGIYFYELRSNKATLKTGKLVKQ